MARKKKPVFNCTHCEYTSSIPSNVRGHVTRVHKIKNPKIHECLFCGEMFANLHKLNFHMGATYCANTNEDFARELEEKAEKRKMNFFCLECNYQSYLSYNVISHMIHVHKIDDPKIHVCKCGESYRRASELKEHTVNCDEADENYRGRPAPPKVKTLKTRFPVRSKVFTHKSKKLIKSKVTMANLVKSPVKKVNTPAKRDNKVRNRSRIKNTAKTSAKEGSIEKVSVNVRNSSSKSRNELNDDQKMGHLLPNKPYYNCQHCDYHSAFKSNIRAHINVVHKTKATKLDPVQKCYQCKRVFPNSVKFKSHVRNGECKVIKSNISVKRQVRKPAKLDRLFECLECDYKSPYTCHVRTHMKLKHNVSEPKIHQCEFCLEMFPTIIILKKHMGVSFCVNTNPEFAQQVREAEENKCYYNCLKCDYLSAYKHHIRNHMRVIHKIADPKFYSCESCGETFGKEGLLSAHMKTCSGQNAKDARRKTKMPNQIYVCEKCGVIFEDKNHFEGHKEFTNCKKRRKIIRKGEIFGEAELPPNVTVQNIDDIENLTAPKRKLVTKKVTGKNVRTGKRPAGRTPAKRSYQARKRSSNNKKKEVNEENGAQFIAIPPQKPRQPLPVPVTFEMVKKEPEPASLNVGAEIEPKTDEEIAEQESLIIEEKPILNHQYLNTEPEEHLDENDYNGSENYIVDTIESVETIETDEPIAIETTEVEGPSTDSENYYIFDDLSSTYVTESQNFIVAGIDGAVYDGDLEIGEGFNIDPTSTANDSVFYQLQFCDGSENVIFLED